MDNLNTHTFCYAEFCKHYLSPSTTYHLKLQNGNQFIAVDNIPTFPCLIHNEAFNFVQHTIKI